MDRNQINEIKAFIMKADRETLRAIGGTMKLRREQLDNKKKRGLYVGATVKFKGKYGRIEEGIVEKINPKTIKIRVGSALWRVSPFFLITEDE